jgi:thiol:disulfide interchange protein DsbD
MRFLSVFLFRLFFSIWFAVSVNPWGLAQAQLVQNQARTPAAPGPILGPVRVGTLEAELISDRAAVAPGQSFRLGLRLKHDPQWHTYWRNPGDSGLPTRWQVTLPSGWSTGQIQWPAPHRIRVGPMANFGYDGEIVLPLQVTPPDRLTGRDVQLEATASWLVCREICIPGEASLAIRLPLSQSQLQSQSDKNPSWDALFAAADQWIPDPNRVIDAVWFTGDKRVILAFPPPPVAHSTAPPAQVEFTFFPERERVVAPAADQTLERLADGRWRLRLELAPDGAPDAVSGDALDGVLRLGGRAYQVRASRGGGAEPSSGEPIGISVLTNAVNPANTTSVSKVPSERSLMSRLVPNSTPASSLATATATVQTGAEMDPLGLALVLAGSLLGGLLLNLMPCVFPVVGLKVLGFVQDAGGDSVRARRNAFAFAAGVVAMFLGLAALMLLLRSAGQAVGWGFQLQSPAVVSLLALLFLALGLNFSGVYEIGLRLTTLGGASGGLWNGSSNVSAHGIGPSFAAGLLAAVVATPCTAPFMGAAVGFTLTATPAIALLVFSAIGLGMAAPYLLLGIYPEWIVRLPRPGQWMETLRQGLAFPMYATAVWLVWVLGAQLGVDAMLRTLMAGVLVAAAAWWWGRTGTKPSASSLSKSVPAASLLVLAVALASPRVVNPVRSEATQDWATWSPEAVSAARVAGRTVFVDFTAAWCISCQVNKKLVLEGEAVRQAFSDKDVLLLRADWTRQDPTITKALADFGRNGVPLYLVYRPGQDTAQVLPELLTANVVVDALTTTLR